MKNNTVIRRIFVAVLTMVFLTGTTMIYAEGLLPSLTQTVGIAMPSLGEALGRYPDSETENADGSVTELYTNVSESDFNTFSIYLERLGAELADYSVKNGVLTAEIRAKGVSFGLEYASKISEVSVTYPAGTFDEWVKNAKTHFEAALKLLAEGKTDEAYAEIFAIRRFTAYGPVDSLMKNDDNFAAAAAAREAKFAPYREAGNIVTFGIYPQTAAGTDSTPIEWIVLDYDEANHKVLLLSRYGLEAKPYNTESTYVTWETCTLRAWLNSDFLNKVFNAEEKSAILTAAVDNSAGQGYSGWSTDGGNNTQDKIFLLSYAEANRYLGVKYWKDDDGNNTKSRVAPTEYAIKTGAWTSDSYQTADGKPAGWWWLRSPGAYQDCAAFVLDDGSLVDISGVSTGRGVVRPAFWLNLESGIF